MKINPLLSLFIVKNQSFKDYFRIMRVTLFLLFACGFQLLAMNTEAQNSIITFSSNSISVGQLIEEIERQTDYLVVYSNREIDINSRVTIRNKSDKVSSFLKEALVGVGINYKFENDYIILSKNDSQLDQLQQQEKITGTVTDAKGEPIIGANVTIMSKSIGTITDIDGNFTIQASQNDMLQVSFIGYQTHVTKVEGKHITILLQEDAEMLEEIVVVGYGTQKKSLLTSSVASVKSENFVTGSIKDIGQVLQGKVAGLSISTTSGDPTAGTDIMLRGVNTLNGSNSPLVLIDGIPGNLQMLSPEDIESIDILKDGSSAAIYGTRATNGVILITTKKGSAEKMEVEYNTYISTEQFFNKPDVLTAAEWCEKRAIGEHANLNWNGNTDWLDAIQRKNMPLTHYHSVSLRGGSEKTNYMASVNFRGAEGIFRNSDAKQTNARLNLNHRMFNDKVAISLNYLTNFRNFTTTVDGDGSFNATAYSYAIRSNPTGPVTVIDPVTGKSRWMEPQPDFGVSEGVVTNPVAMLEEGIGLQKQQRNTIYGTISVYPITGLKLDAHLSYQRYNMTRGFATTFEHPDVANNPAAKKGRASRASYEMEDRLLELTAQYSNTFLQKHAFTVLAGYSYSDHYREGFGMDNSDFPTDQFTYNNIGIGKDLAEGLAGMASHKYSGNLIGFFGRLNYSFDDKYLLTASLRYEGDSKFIGSNKEWGVFPAVSAAWRIKQEEFMKDVDFINDLKLRTGFGVTGIAPNVYYQSYYRLGYTSNDNSFYYNGKWINILEPRSNRNPEFTWETKNEWNIGLDFAMFNNRLSGNIDYYNRETRNLLYNYGVPVPPNAYSTMLKNVGVISNHGIEILVNVIPVKTKDFEWSSTITFSTNSNKLKRFYTDYSETVDYMEFYPFGDEMNQQMTHRIQVGKPIGELYTWKYLGVDSQGRWVTAVKGKEFNPDDPDTYNIYTGEGSLPAENRQYVGNAIPKFYAGFNNYFSYKNFDFGVTMRGAFGYQLLNRQRARIGIVDPGKVGYNVLSVAYEKQPVVVGEGRGTSVVPTNNITLNSFFVEDADFWKIDNITLGYTLKSNKIPWLNSLRLYASVSNAFCFTNYSGTDPEVGTGGLTPGIDWEDKYPTTRVYTIGLNVKF